MEKKSSWMLTLALPLGFFFLIYFVTFLRLQIHHLWNENKTHFFGEFIRWKHLTGLWHWVDVQSDFLIHVAFLCYYILIPFWQSIDNTLPCYIEGESCLAYILSQIYVFLKMVENRETSQKMQLWSWWVRCISSALAKFLLLFWLFSIIFLLHFQIFQMLAKWALSNPIAKSSVFIFCKGIIGWQHSE